MKKNKNKSVKKIEEKERQVDLEIEELPAPKIDFDTWFILRRDLIPSHHHKEIIKADFMARKMPKLCTIEQFDDALKKYGLKVN